ncbi:MAG: pilus assembly protein PilM [Minisyncoccia bacterium]
MNLLNLLTKEKRVAGIEISDSVVRIAFFHQNGKKKSRASIHLVALNKSQDAKTETQQQIEPDDELILIEEPIASNIIADGVVVDADLLTSTLKEIWSKAKLGTDYAVVAIPDDKIYSRIFSFPKSVTEERITEAMRLAISFQLPVKTEDAYLDWERTPGTTTANEILLSTIPREVAEGYVRALEKAGIKTVALESHLASIARAVKLASGETTIFSKKTPDGATIFVLRDGILRFSRTLPVNFVPESDLHSEIKKIKDAIASETKGAITEQDLVNATVRDEHSNREEITEPKSKWLIALGAAMRGKIPEGKDNLVSLLPVGTEEAYSYQRATTFITLMRNLFISISIFFVSAYLVTYISMLSLLQKGTEQVTTLSSSAIPPELVEKEKLIAEVNVITETGAKFLAQMPIWSVVLTELVLRTPDGITISTFSAPNFTDRFSLAGNAKNRTILNNYKKTLQESAMLSEVELPLTNLDKEENIPFSISFRLKDPGAIYFNSNQAH